MNIALIIQKVPHIFNGAYSYNKIGCCKNIYLLFTHNAFIYPYSKFTCLGTFDVRTDNSLSITLSTLISSFLYIWSNFENALNNLSMYFINLNISGKTIKMNENIFICRAKTRVKS